MTLIRPETGDYGNEFAEGCSGSPISNSDAGGFWGSPSPERVTKTTKRQRSITKAQRQHKARPTKRKAEVEDEEDEEVKKIRNRMAAQKHRTKRRFQEERTAERIKMLERRNAELRLVAEEMQRRVRELVSSVAEKRGIVCYREAQLSSIK